MNRKQRRAEKAQDDLDTKVFVKIANKFIDVANQENRTVKATDLHMAFLYAAARYNAYVAKAILDVDDQEEFVQRMSEQYAQMLRSHLTDTTLDTPVN